MSSEQMVPILKDTKDPHYRYKMPKLTAKVEGSGNGIRTVITNMSAISRSLHRPASYPTKFFGCELGAQVTMNNEFVVNGSHDPDKLLNLLYAFIRKFVLCKKCKNPETNLNIANGRIGQKCIACGYDTEIPKTIHKLTTYIINHPPDESGINTVQVAATTKVKSKSKNKLAASGATGQKSPTNEKSSSKAGKNKGDDVNNNNNNNNNNGGIMVSGNGVVNDDGGGEDAFSDEEEFTAEAYTQRLNELREIGMHVTDAKESANIFYSLVKEKRDSGEIHETQVQKDLLKEAESLEIKDKSTLVLSELLLTEKSILEDIKTYRTLFLRFCYENKKAQKYLLGGFEKLVGDVYQDTLFPLCVRILKQLYDQDIVEEETIIEWSAKKSKKYVSKEMSKKIHEKVEPFVKWLQEADEETSSEEEEEENDESSSSSSKSNSPPAQQQQHQQNQKQNQKQQSAVASAAAGRKQSLDEDDDDDDMFEFSHRVQGIQIVETTAVAPSAKANASGKQQQQQQQEDDEEEIDDDEIDNI